MIRVVNADCKTVETFDLEHTPENVQKIAGNIGTLTNLDLSSDCIYLGTFADGSVFGFLI